MNPLNTPYTHTAYIGVGSNVGNRADNCQKGIGAVAALDGCLLEIRSPLYETEPVDLKDQNWFINGVFMVRTCLEPKALLIRLQAIEQAMGRRLEGPRFGPRVLDLDILFFDELVLQTTQIHIPHPRLHQRRFVLKPLCDIAPELVHPVFVKPVRSLLSGLKDGENKVTLVQ